ncbi:hypothetical protein, partial [Bacteroides sp. 519]|uniref:hypothetical protein n=1 Tax=Bacteroides sp. 519 TaxID=2302937 RepID=UPI0013D0A9BE
GAEPLGVQIYFDETSYQTMFEALADVLISTGVLVGLIFTFIFKLPILDSVTASRSFLLK